jgi:NADPH:quinone reductase-like Zn-dependent oxidoreductase
MVVRVMELRKPGGLENLVAAERERPVPGPGEVVVRWRATSLNFHDLSVVLGRIPTEDRRIPMSDGAGEVVAIGSGVSRWREGDRVLSQFFPDWITGPATDENTARVTGDRIDGFAAEYTSVGEWGITAMPDGWDWAEAATLPCAALTAWRALVVEGGLKVGDSVLVEGTGGLSLFALQIALSSGARVFATTSSPEKAERLRELGAYDVLDYRKETKWGERVRELSGGGVDHVLDVGGADTLAQSLRASKIGGHVVCIGVLGGRDAELFLPGLFFNQQRLSGIAVGSARMQEDMVAAFETVGLRPVVDAKRFGLEELPDAFRYQESGRHFGKIVVEY